MIGQRLGMLRKVARWRWAASLPMYLDDSLLKLRIVCLLGFRLSTPAVTKARHRSVRAKFFPECESCNEVVAEGDFFGSWEVDPLDSEFC